MSFLLLKGFDINASQSLNQLCSPLTFSSHFDVLLLYLFYYDIVIKCLAAVFEDFTLQHLINFKNHFSAIVFLRCIVISVTLYIRRSNRQN